MSAGSVDHELDDVIHRAQAALRRQESEIADVLKGVDRAKALMARAKAEIESERSQDADERRVEEERARTGELGSERKALQRRIDAQETTWADVLSGRDEHHTADAYREAIGQQARAVVDRLREDDPEWGEAFDRFGPDQPVDFPDAPVDDRIDPLSPDTFGDPGYGAGRRPDASDTDRDDRRPPPGGGTW